MAPKKSATSASISSSSSKSSNNAQSYPELVESVWNTYLEKTPQRTKLLDAFMAFLVLVGGLQFIYCVVAGNYPFNAFLSGFGATVGQFVLTAALRIQQSDSPQGEKGEFKARSPEKAFAEFVLGSLILHFFCINFIN